MSNDNPPRACLADFGFMTMVLDPGQPLPCSAQLEGGTMTFMSPELLVPSAFGLQDSVPTPEADVYAFGLLIFQVCEQDRGHRPFSHIAQVLTGQIPFRGIRQMELGWAVVHGLRPDRPENALSIGFSDPLWDFVESCWGGDMKLRPKVSEVVTRLGKEAAEFDGLMPPSPPAENVAPVYEDPPADALELCEILILGFLRHCSPRNGTGGIIPSYSNAPPESPTESQAIPGSPDRWSTLPIRDSEPPQEGPQVVVTKPFEGPHGDLQGPEMYPHLDQRYKPPPAQLPGKKRKGIKRYVNLKLPESFKRPPIPPARPSGSVRTEHLAVVSREWECDQTEHRELECLPSFEITP